MLRLQGDMPMVSDGHWDELLAIRYPTLDSVPDDLAQVTGSTADVLLLITKPAG